MKAQITNEERYARSIQGLRVVEGMLIQSANSGQSPNQETCDAAAGVVNVALETFKELEILELVGARD